MSKHPKAKRSLKSFTPEELRTLARTQKERITSLKADKAALEEDNKTLATANAELQLQYDMLREQFDQAVHNNSRLQGMLDSAAEDEGDSPFDDSALRLLVAGQARTNQLLIAALIANGVDIPPENEEDEDDLDDDDSDDDAVDEDSEDEEEEETPAADAGISEPSAEDVAIPVEPAAEVEAPAETPAPVEPAPEPALAEGEAAAIADAIVAADPVAEPAADPVIQAKALIELVVPAIKAHVDGDAAYADNILGEVQKGALSKELALRAVVSKVYPDHPDMAETILSSDEVRNAVYTDAMGL